MFSQNIQGKFCTLTTDVATYLGEGLRGIGSKFLRSSQMLTTCSDCPTIYIDADTVSAVGRIQRLGSDYSTLVGSAHSVKSEKLNKVLQCPFFVFFLRLCPMDSLKR